MAVDGHVIGVGHLLTVNIERAALGGSDGDHCTCCHGAAADAEARSLRSGSKVAGIGGADHVAGHAVARRAGIDRHAATHLVNRGGEAIGVGLPVVAVGAPLDGAGRITRDGTADGRAREMGTIGGRNRHVDVLLGNGERASVGIDGDGVNAGTLDLDGIIVIEVDVTTAVAA